MELQLWQGILLAVAILGSLTMCFCLRYMIHIVYDEVKELKQRVTELEKRNQ
jgi:hypothetical protein